MKIALKKSLAVFLALITLFSCFGFTAFADNGEEYAVVRQNCTVYGDPKTQKGFTWYTAADCDSVLQLVKASDFSRNGFTNALEVQGKSKKFQGNYCHKVAVTGLEPGTTYYYRVGSLKNNIWSNVGKFVTDNGDSKFSFIAIADVQASSFENFYKASCVMKEAVKYNKNAEFIVNLGDFVNDCTNDEWGWYGETFKEFNTNYTLVPVAGNHEGNPTNKFNPGWFANQFNLDAAEGSLQVNGVYYSYDYGDAHFCVLNTNDMYPMTEAQRNWIYNDLNGSSAKWKILLMHRAAYSAGKNINKPDTLAMRKTIIEIVDNTDVDLVLSGHDHMYMRTYQVKGDAVCEDTRYVTEMYNGKEVTFAMDPDGAVYALPGTAGTKRYAVNTDAIDPILQCAEVAETLRDRGGAFANITVDGDRLIYEAFIVKDDTHELEKIDEYAIKKTTAGSASDEPEKPTDFFGTIDQTVINFVTEIIGVIVTYITKLLPQIIIDSFKK
ncbi:MAG: metallophosphoesterase family protein [Oscillospiraceae bacterium]|nr:metallophosphoesterase family protein [Oscillospiraceae bacterium]MDD7469591.1 metallophosphoesterase family protein [Oscillospiraceae bacterium]MDY2677676.1 metallophosphoesterase family protein [Oscillospiraceae bacterium]